MIQRTTVAAASEDLEALRAEARRQGLSFSRYMQRLIAEQAETIRRARRPRFGVVRSSGGVALESVVDEEGPAAG